MSKTHACVYPRALQTNSKLSSPPSGVVLCPNLSYPSAGQNLSGFHTNSDLSAERLLLDWGGP